MVASVLALLLAQVAPPVEAAPTQPSLERARALVRDELRYSEAVPLLRRALSDPDLAPADRALACELLGVAYLAQGDAERAGAVLWELFRQAPDHAVAPELSPKIQDAVNQARARARSAPRIEDLVAVPADGRVEVQARLRGADGELGQLLLHLHRADGQQRSVPLARRGDALSATLPLELWAELGQRPRCHVTGQDAAGQLVAQLGSLDAPVALPLGEARPAAAPAPSAPPVAAADDGDAGALPWIVGLASGSVLLAVAAATSYVIFTYRPDPPAPAPEHPTGTLPPIQLD